MDALEGGCFCGRIRYRVSRPRGPALCHCGMCRRASGAPAVAWATAAEADLALLEGTPTWFPSSEHAARAFCPRCGTPLFFRSRHHAGEIDVTVASLDDPEALPPLRHIFWPFRLSWLRLADELPRHEGDSESRRFGEAASPSASAVPGSPE